MPFDLQFDINLFFQQQHLLLLAKINHVIYFSQSQLLFTKTNEDRTATRKAPRHPVRDRRHCPAGKMEPRYRSRFLGFFSRFGAGAVTFYFGAIALILGFKSYQIRTKHSYSTT